MNRTLRSRHSRSMKTKLSNVRPLSALAGAALAGAGLLTSGCGQALAQVASERAPSQGATELTVYSNDFGTVRENRRVELQDGRTRLALPGVSKRLDADSVLFAFGDRKDARVVSTSYDLGVGNGAGLLQRFLGQEIELVFRGQDGRVGERVKGVLEVADPGNLVVRAGDRYIVNPNATIELPVDPASGLVTRPGLAAEIESEKGGAADLALTYATEGLSWSADYNATLTGDSDRMGLEAWASVTNATGTDFPNATLSFVAGSPNRAVRSTRGQDLARSAPMASAGAAESKVQFEAQPQSVGELYAYPFKSTATIRQNVQNRVRLFGSETVAAKRVYSVALPPVYGGYDNFGGNPDRRIPATLGINLTNDEGSGLGQPLPGGTVRVYERGTNGAPTYIGAATIGNTPKGARVSLTLSNVFDIYATARGVKTSRVDKTHTSRSVEVVLHNAKARAAEVRAVQSFGERAKITGESIKSAKLDANTFEWRATVPAGGEVKLTYTVVLGP